MLVVLLTLGALFATASPRRYHETDVSKPSVWRWEAKARHDQKIELIFAVKQTNLRILEDFVLATSDPDSPAYGNHLSRDTVDDLVAPTEKAKRTVWGFLAEHRLQTCKPNGNSDFILCIVDVSTAEKLLGAEYHYYRHANSGRLVVRTPHYSLPEEVSEYVDFVSPTVRFPTVQKRIVYKKNNTGTQEDNTPSRLRTLYKVGDVEGSNGKQSCTAFLEQYFEMDDLKTFWSKYYPKAKGQTIKTVGPDQTIPGVEASLDIQYITAMGGGIDTEFWSFAGRAPDNPQNEPFLKWMYTVANTTDEDIPKVITNTIYIPTRFLNSSRRQVFSTSYGEAERTVSTDYMFRINNEFKKAAARGISLLFATGDFGVTDQGECPNNRFQGQWPAGSPWVTGVGGTQDGSIKTGAPENGWDGSSGGFSDRFIRPSYQENAVAEFFNTVKKSDLPLSKYYNKTGAGFPDVAAQAVDFQVINGGQLLPVAGTSCACPTFSGIVSLLNDLRLAKGKTTL
eukprot:390685-Amorphochlora_amoeboformis.AAC.2